jgi:hypothetical protein
MELETIQRRSSKWDTEGYLEFLRDNGFDVRYSKQLPSTIPLVYTECRLKPETVALV